MNSTENIWFITDIFENHLGPLALTFPAFNPGLSIYSVPKEYIEAFEKATTPEDRLATHLSLVIAREVEEVIDAETGEVYFPTMEMLFPNK